MIGHPQLRRAGRRALHGAAVILAAALSSPSPAQDLAPGASLPRRIEYLAPEGTFVLVRARRLAVDVRGLFEVANRLFGEDGPGSTLLAEPDAARVRAGLLLARGFERNAVGAALEELGQGEVAFGLCAASTGRPRPFLLARLRDKAAARRAMRPFRGTFRLPIVQRGVLLLLAGDARTRRLVEDAVARVVSGHGPTQTAVRIARELRDASLSGWVDLRDAPPGRALRARLAQVPRNPGAAFLAGGLGPVLASADSLVMEAHLSWREVRLDLRAPGVRRGVPAWAANVLGLGGASLPEPPEVPGTLARFRLSRSLAGFLTHRKKAASKQAQPAIQSFLAGMELFFRGARVEEEVFSQLRPGVMGVVALPRPEAATRPELPFRLPTGALVVGLGEKGRLARSLDGAMQVLVTATNNQRRRDGKLAFRLRGKKGEGRRLLYTEPVPPAGGRPWPLDAAFTPALAHTDEWVTIGFSRELGAELLDELAKTPPSTRDRHDLDLLDLRFDHVAQAIRQNRASLEARLLLDRGFEQPRAASWVDALAEVVRMAGRATLRTGFEREDWLLSFRWRPELRVEADR